MYTPRYYGAFVRDPVDGDDCGIGAAGLGLQLRAVSTDLALGRPADRTFAGTGARRNDLVRTFRTGPVARSHGRRRRGLGTAA